jgi:hypothetical protein
MYRLNEILAGAAADPGHVLVSALQYDFCLSGGGVRIKQGWGFRPQFAKRQEA